MKTLVLILLLLLSTPGNSIPTESAVESTNNEIQRVRINFTSATGYVRHLLLGFTPNNEATDGFDYGYDGANIEDLPNDMNWIIEEERYVIQGVGSFSENKVYPLGMFLSDSGVISINLQSLENFDTNINVFIYDSLVGSYTQINNSSFSIDLDPGDYLDRFFITFSNPSMGVALSTAEHIQKNLKIYFSKRNNKLTISHPSAIIDEIIIYDLLGKRLVNKKNINESTLDIQFDNLNNGPVIIKLIINDLVLTTKHIF
ncbi:hypothetical protein [Winogradskyella tangerina]|uniref:hypothetical protein n=1 Tax=Winogradskyella tangerina TaxID=2023240 RepID=UPI000DBE7A4F|nr:hypothetical protein [Winogradskyella tangerina]